MMLYLNFCSSKCTGCVGTCEDGCNVTGEGFCTVCSFDCWGGCYNSCTNTCDNANCLQYCGKISEHDSYNSTCVSCWGYACTDGCRLDCKADCNKACYSCTDHCTGAGCANDWCKDGCTEKKKERSKYRSLKSFYIK